MAVNPTVTIKTRQRRGTGALAFDLKQRLKTWEDVQRVDDFVNEDERQIVYTLDVGELDHDRSWWELLLKDVFDDHATFLDLVVIKIGTVRMARYDYQANRKEERELTSDDLGVTHLRKKGDPYIEVDDV